MKIEYQEVEIESTQFGISAALALGAACIGGMLPFDSDLGKIAGGLMAGTAAAVGLYAARHEKHVRAPKASQAPINGSLDEREIRRAEPVGT